MSALYFRQKKRPLQLVVGFAFVFVAVANVEAGPYRAPRKVKGADYRVYSADGHRELTHLRGNNFVHTRELITEHVEPGKRVLIGGDSLKIGRNGKLKLYYNDIGGSGAGYAGLPCTLEVEVQPANAATRLKPTAIWLHYPFLQRPTKQRSLAEPPKPNPAALLTYRHNDNQKQAWAEAPSCDGKRQQAPRLNELQRFLANNPEALQHVLRLVADDHAVYEYLQSHDLRLTTEALGVTDGARDVGTHAIDITRDEVRTYCSAIRRNMRSNGSRDPFGFNIELASPPKPDISADTVALPKSLVDRYINPKLLPQAYADILAALHHWKISDITSVLDGLSNKAPKEWSPEYFMQLVVGSWKSKEADKRADTEFLVDVLGKGKSKSLGFKKDDYSRFKSLTDTDGLARLQNEMPILVHFAKRAAFGDPPLGSLAAQALMSQSPIEHKLAILEACERNGAIDQNMQDMLLVRRPTEIVLEAIETSDQHGIAQKALREYGIPDDVVLKLVAKRWVDKVSAAPEFKQEAHRHNARQLLEIVDTLRDKGMIAADALSPITLANPGSINLNEDAIANALMHDSAIETKLTRAVFEAVRAANPAEIRPNQFDRLASRVTIDQLHKRQDVFVHWVFKKRALKSGPDRLASNKLTNDGLNTAMASLKPNHELIQLIDALAHAPQIKQRHMRIAMKSEVSTEKLLEIIAGTHEINVKGKELESLLRVGVEDVQHALALPDNLKERQRALTLQRYRKKMLNWSDIALIVQNSPRFGEARALSQLMAEHMSPAAVARVWRAIAPVVAENRPVIGFHEYIKLPKSIMVLHTGLINKVVEAVTRVGSQLSLSDELIATGAQNVARRYMRVDNRLDGKRGLSSFVDAVNLTPDISANEMSRLLRRSVGRWQTSELRKKVFEHLVKPRKPIPAKNDSVFRELTEFSQPMLAQVLHWLTKRRAGDVGMPAVIRKRLADHMAARMHKWREKDMPKLTWQDVGWLIDNYLRKKPIANRASFIEKMVAKDEIESMQAQLQYAVTSQLKTNGERWSKTALAVLPFKQREMIVTALLNDKFAKMGQSERTQVLERIHSMLDDAESSVTRETN